MLYIGVKVRIDLTKSSWANGLRIVADIIERYTLRRDARSEVPVRPSSEPARSFQSGC
jgi:hypothetical protein